MWQKEWNFQSGWLEREVSLWSKKASLHLTIPKLIFFKQISWKKNFKPREITHNAECNLKGGLHLSLAWPCLTNWAIWQPSNENIRKKETRKNFLWKVAAGSRKQGGIILVFQEEEHRIWSKLHKSLLRTYM